MDFGQARDETCAPVQGREETSLLPSSSHLPSHCPELPFVPRTCPPIPPALHLHHGTAGIKSAFPLCPDPTFGVLSG